MALLQVEGPPPAWYGSSHWHRGDLEEGNEQLEVELGSHRVLYRGRRYREDLSAWRVNADAQAALRANIQAVLSSTYERHEEVRAWVGLTG